MFEIVDGRTTDDRRRTDAGVTGILLAHPRAFGSGELKIRKKINPETLNLFINNELKIYKCFLQLK